MENGGVQIDRTRAWKIRVIYVTVTCTYSSSTTWGNKYLDWISWKIGGKWGATGGQSKIDNQGTKIFLYTVYLLSELQEDNYERNKLQWEHKNEYNCMG